MNSKKVLSDVTEKHSVRGKIELFEESQNPALLRKLILEKSKDMIAKIEVHEKGSKKTCAK